MTTIKHAAPASTVLLLSTELDYLPDGDSKFVIVSNDAAGELFLWADFELNLDTPATSRSYRGRADLYILTEMDGVNYSYGGDYITPSISNLVGSFFLWESNIQKVLHLKGVRLPPTDFKVLLRNMSTNGSTFGTNNFLRMAKYNLQAS